MPGSLIGMQDPAHIHPNSTPETTQSVFQEDFMEPTHKGQETKGSQLGMHNRIIEIHSVFKHGASPFHLLETWVQYVHEKISAISISKRFQLFVVSRALKECVVWQMVGMHNTQYPNEDVILLVVSSVWNNSSSLTWFLCVHVNCVTYSEGLMSEATVKWANK